MYCTIEDIQHLAKSDYFARMNTPNDTELGAIADLIEGEIDGYLMQHGYDLPVKDPVLYKYCASLNAYGVAGAIERKSDQTEDRKGLFQSKYEKGLSMLSSRRWVRYAATTTLPANTTAESTEW